MNSRIVIIVALLAVSVSAAVYANDWPTWRHDANRSAATAEQLPEELHLQWTLKLKPLTPAWPEDARLHFDAHYEPVVAGDTMFVSSSRNHLVTAVDINTGKQRWRFFAIEALLAKNISYSAIGRIMGVHRLTVKDFVKSRNLKPIE